MNAAEAESAARSEQGSRPFSGWDLQRVDFAATNPLRARKPVSWQIAAGDQNSMIPVVSIYIDQSLRWTI
jgi:hypothetical protein